MHGMYNVHVQYFDALLRGLDEQKRRDITMDDGMG